MKTATIPSLRVDPTLREAAQDVLREGETLSALIETSLRAQIELRQSQTAFVSRGLASRDKAGRSGTYISSTDALNVLESKLAKAKTSRT